MATAPTVAELPSIILQLGAWTLRANMSTHQAPVALPACVARLTGANKDNSDNSDKSGSNGRQIYAWEGTRETLEERERANEALVAHMDSSSELMTRLKVALRSEDSSGKCVINVHEVSAEGAALAAATALPPLLVGEKALSVAADAPYVVRFPFHGGRINWSQYGSPREVETDLLALWQHTISQELHVPLERLPGHSIALIVPDLCSAREISLFVRILLNELHFAGVFVLRQSVCAAVGAARMPACVVDIGHSHTSVACVAETSLGGLDLVRTSALKMKWGGHHVTRTLQHLLSLKDSPGEPTWWPWQVSESLALQQSATHYLAASRFKESLSTLISAGRQKHAQCALVIRETALRATTYSLNINPHGCKALRYAAFTLVAQPPPTELVQRGEQNPIPSHASHDPEDNLGLAYVKGRAHQLSDAAGPLRDWLGVDAERVKRKQQRRLKEDRRDAKQLNQGDDEDERESPKKAERKRKRAASKTAPVPTAPSASSSGTLIFIPGASASFMASSTLNSPPVTLSEPSSQPLVSEAPGPSTFPPAGKQPSFLRPPPSTQNQGGDDAMDKDFDFLDSNNTNSNNIYTIGEGDDAMDIDQVDDPRPRVDLTSLPPSPLGPNARVRFTLPSPPRSERHRAVGVARAIVESISQIKEPLVRAACAEAIVLTGGAAQIPGVLEAIEDALVEIAPRDLPRMHVVTPKEVGAEQNSDPVNIMPRYAWLGAQKLLQFVDAADFIDKETWQRLGPYAALRARLHFSPDDADAL